MIGGRGDPYAVRTMFSWILCGPLSNDGNYSASINFISRPGNPIGDDLERLYNHAFGDIADDRVSMSREDQAALAVVTETTRHNGTQFEVPLPWQTGSNRLPGNREIALHRLNYLEGRLKRNAQLKEAYCNAMKRNLELGYIEHAMGGIEKEQPLWHLPHHPVINPKKPQKIRVVFDCAAKCAGITLNDRLLQGSDLTIPQVGVLCGFRLGSVAVAADIEEVFMQVKDPKGPRMLYSCGGVRMET
ncbi:unnamed protein product [Echinostoma caproni]|uniref:DUF1758 domain-containing protein n=1 Tax=Echinostoma caproni TaxID=27848 RepID=A0A183B2Q3_9TREM|nr:unnamed protein product [Echinostoma caproni]